MALLDPRMDLDRRLPVWVAMTDFYLDTEMGEVTLKYIARVCAASPYTPRQLDRIMFAEVWPAFLPNLMSYAGEWAGWNDDVVCREVLRCYRKRWYVSWRLNPLKLWFCHDWAWVRRETRRLRSSGPAM